MKFFDEEEYRRAKRLAKRSFWSGIALVTIGAVIAVATLGHCVSHDLKRASQTPFPNPPDDSGDSNNAS